ncbi:MAG: cupin domain-containing protein [Bacillota bacterium]|nr:cupin domain-containing protein [Bacillota bacterium]
MVKKERIVKVDGLRDGRGSVEIHHVLEADEMMGHGTMYAKVVIKPQSSIGWHQHVGNTEPYYILKGTGVFVDNDGSRTEVQPGDVCTIEVGQWHSIENNTDEDLEVMAIVLNENLK